jgi:hypothetical protein
MIGDEALVPHDELPDPLVFEDGSRVTAAGEWRARRRQILDLFAEHVYGVTREVEVTTEATILEDDSVVFGGAALRRQTRLTLRLNGSAIEIDLLAHLPARLAGPLPTIVVANFRGNHTVNPDPAIRVSQRARRDLPGLSSERGEMAHRFPIGSIVARGFQLVTYCYGDVVPDVADLGGGRHALFTAGSAGRAPNEWGAIGVWAWGASRVLEHLLTDPCVDRDRVAIAGHSRLGKAALWAAAQDERFAAVFANDSGCTGAAIAPRPVYVASAAHDVWADPHGEYLGAARASPVYQLLGFEGLSIDRWPPGEKPSTGRIGYHLRPGGHDLLEADWSRFLDFADVVLRQR